MGAPLVLTPTLAAATILGTAAATAAATAAPAASRPGPSAAPVRLTIDTDFGQWWDDVAALAMVHTAADAGRVRRVGGRQCHKHQF